MNNAQQLLMFQTVRQSIARYYNDIYVQNLRTIVHVSVSTRTEILSCAEKSIMIF